MPEASTPTPTPQAPRFELPTHAGGTWSLDDHVGPGHDRAVVLVFHRHIH